MKTQRRRLATGLMVAAAALTLAACGSNSSTSTGTTGGGGANTIKTASTSIGTVLTDSAGRTVYWFSIDTSTKSNCTDSACVGAWPFVPGPVTAASGVSLPDSFGTITRSDGSVQATYDGHPLYTYSGDNGPGQTNGNKLPLNGGTWHAMTPTGAMASSPAVGHGY